jgi:hypothetical protein
MREGFSFRTIGTMLDGTVCMWANLVEAKQRLSSVVNLLDPQRDAKAIADATKLKDNPMASASSICNAARQLEGEIHQRYISEGSYLGNL